MERNFLRILLLAQFLDHFISSESFPHPLRKRAQSVDTTYSSTAAAAKSSPPVSVCHKWCYISLVFPAGARSAPAGPRIVLVPPRSMFIYIYVCPHLMIIMPFIHVVLEECTP